MRSAETKHTVLTRAYLETAHSHMGNVSQDEERREGYGFVKVR